VFPARTTLWKRYLEDIVPLLATLFIKKEEPVPEPVEGEEPAVPTPAAPEGEGQDSEGAAAVALEPEPEVNDYGIFDIEAEADATLEEFFSLTTALLPAPKVPPLDKDAIPDPSDFQVYKRPYSRMDRRSVSHFEILPYTPPPAEGEEGEAAVPTEGAEGAVEAAPGFRWLIEPFGKVQFKVRFTSKSEGKFESQLGFEAVGTKMDYSVFCVGHCQVPQVNGDARNVFMRRIKGSVPGAPLPHKRYIQNTNSYSFGPLLQFKDAAWRAPPSEDTSEEAQAQYALVQNTNMDVIRMTNTGRYPCSLAFDFEDQSDEVKDVFLVDPKVVQLEEGETKEVSIMAFPRESKAFTNRLVACVSDNPAPMTFDMTCSGVDPEVEIGGPWLEDIATAEAALAANADPKAAKELEAAVETAKGSKLIDFDRMLVGKTESRVFSARNLCELPVVWSIDMLDFGESTNIDITPKQGKLVPGADCTIVVSFTSEEPLEVTGKFVFKYGDAEGGLEVPDRTKTSELSIKAEAYKITAVSLTAAGEEEGGSEVDFGLMRVGDFASQVVKMKNLGKYKIAYDVSLKRPKVAQLLQIEPTTGEIEPESEAEIKVTFCARDGEVVLRHNKDVRVRISEPLTGEVVEEFPLLISGETLFNRLRCQPAKGVSFGAVRFDSAAKEKSVEVRNDGKFDFIYVVCPDEAEHNEIDALDDPAFAAFAFGTPAARREEVMGENYLARMGGGGAAAAKGKGAPAATDSAESNPLIYDPDGLALGALPDSPLVIGAFTVKNRVGRVMPGETTSFNISFDPSGCDSVRERLRIRVTGTDDMDAIVHTVKAFDLTGDSCYPTITTEDTVNIFEEQEVIDALADLQGGGGDDGPSDKLGPGRVVYAEADKTLAFGPVMCNQGLGRGVVERIKISNPTKIDVKVNIKVTQAAGGGAAAAPAKGKGAAPVAEEGASSIFSVMPEVWEIPPHEHRFVSVYFNPSELKTYKASFEANVDTGDSSVDKKQSTSLKFDIVGSGTMPCIAIEAPTERSAEGALQVAFGKVHVDRKRSAPFTIRNNGVMPATCLFEVTGDDSFDFAAKGASVNLEPGASKELPITFAPKVVGEEDGAKVGTIKVSVLNNPFDMYTLDLTGSTYACDAVVDTSSVDDVVLGDSEEQEGKGEDVRFESINLVPGLSTTSKTITLKSQSKLPLKFDFKVGEGVPDNFTFSPKTGHLGAMGSRQVTITFTPTEAVKVEGGALLCSLTRIEYKSDPTMLEVASDVDNERAEEVGAEIEAQRLLWGKWDDSMQTVRQATADELEDMAADAATRAEYEAAVEVETAKGKKGKIPDAPSYKRANLRLTEESAANEDEDAIKMVKEVISEPYSESVPDAEEQTVNFRAFAVADNAKYVVEGDGQNIPFVPTYMYQSSVHSFEFKNESNIAMPVNWAFDNMKRKGTAGTRAGTRLASRAGTTANTMATVPCPFTVEPELIEVPANSSQRFTLKFLPLEAEDFVYLLRGETLLTLHEPAEGEAAPPASDGDLDAQGPQLKGPIRMVVRGTAKRPICHFDMKESPEYLQSRPANMKNEMGLVSPIEASEIRVVEVESVGLRTRNTFRFHIINPTNDSFEFLWESCGESQPAWRCVQSAGMLFAGKRVEIIFEFLPEELGNSEAFFKFKLPTMGLEQMFLFAGKVREPRVAFSTSKLDFHSCMLGGEGHAETIYLENKEHLPFNFAFDRQQLQQLEGPHGPLLSISPRSGMVQPHGRFPIELLFKPQDEVHYNFNINCEVKRKPNKLSLNLKGEGYAVHPLIQLEQPDEITGGTQLVTLKPSPAVNYADFGAVQVLDQVKTKLIVTNNGKYNFDFLWDVDGMHEFLSLTGGKMSGTLHKGEEGMYTVTYAPMTEGGLDQCRMSFTVAGKYTYTILPRGTAMTPALRFSFMHHDFGPCFVTAPGGSTVVEETTLRLVNHDPSSNISVECAFQKTRTLWAECAPTVIEPGGFLDVPIRFAPRDVKEYMFVIPFLVNGMTKVPINISGAGVNPRLELANQSQRRVNFGTVNVGSDQTKTVMLVNRSRKALPVQLIEEGGKYGGGALRDRSVTFSPESEVMLGPRESLAIPLSFSPGVRVSQFNEDLMIRYAGMTRKLLSVAGKAQGIEAGLDTDSLPFGTVVEKSQKSKKLALENTGDLAITYQWMEGSFGPHFRISPIQGKVGPGDEVMFEVNFTPAFTDDDIRQDNIMLAIPGMTPLSVTCSGACIGQPDDSVQTLSFESAARKESSQSIKVANPTDKDWFVQPSMRGEHWIRPPELKVPAKGSADLQLVFFPLSMTRPTPVPEGEEPGAPVPHAGQLFLALPDGTAQLYNLSGLAGEPECSGSLSIDTPAKKPARCTIKLANWLGEAQKFDTSIEMIEQASPATFLVAANAIEIGPHGQREFHMRFNSYVEGTTKARVTFTNPNTGEYSYYDINATSTTPEVLETIPMEAPVRQSSRYILTVENPLGTDAEVAMGSVGKPEEWWSCDSSEVRVAELAPLQGNPEGQFEVEYRPLKPTTETREHLLTLMSTTLGTFKYKITVIATAPTLKQTLRFEVPLGSSQEENFNFTSFGLAASSATCEVKNEGVFQVGKTVAMEAAPDWDGVQLKVPVTFEPTEIGTTKDTLTLTAADGGKYTCELVATCTAPLPQGPFDLAPGGSRAVDFRNCFPAAANFAFSVDSPSFKVGSASANVGAKSNGSVSVSFAPVDGATGVISAKLFVLCADRPDVPPWVYYLRGKV
jgi:hydrocephalus-inducing protein